MSGGNQWRDFVRRWFVPVSKVELLEIIDRIIGRIPGDTPVYRLPSKPAPAERGSGAAASGSSGAAASGSSGAAASGSGTAPDIMVYFQPSLGIKERFGLSYHKEGVGREVVDHIVANYIIDDVNACGLVSVSMGGIVIFIPWDSIVGFELSN